jgi:Spy/CpxP family protein refolding chaperone
MDLHDLKLTAQQHKAVEAAMKEYQHAYRSYHRQSEKTQKELNELFLHPTFDETLFTAKNLELERTSVEIRTQLFSRLHALLTPEQKRRFVRHIEEWDIE